jgi:hypothetical protein
MPVYPIKGVTTLSRLAIDIDKDWQAKGITNIKEVAAGMAVGDIIYHDGSVIKKLEAGPSGYELLTGGPTHAPGWGFPDVGVLGWTITGVIVAGADDSTGVAGVYDNAATECRCGNTAGSALHTAMRFRNITLPVGAKILAAQINMVAQFSRAAQKIYSNIVGELSAAPAVYGAAEDFTLRAVTSHSKVWDGSLTWVINNQYNTPDLSPIVQELVDAYAPYVNGVMAFQWRNNGSTLSNYQSAYTFESAPGLTPVLVIRWGWS